MTEKVKLTREQAEAVDNWLSAATAMDGISALLDAHADMERWVGVFAPMNDLSQADMARALLIGYEIEKEYKIGDWVVWETEHERRVLQIDRISKLTTGEKVFGDEGFWLECIKRHATPEEIKAEQERRVWKKIGREVGEFQFQDIVTFLDNENYIVTDYTNTSAGVVSKKRAYEAYKSGSLNGFFPRESFISFEQEADSNA